MGASSIRPRAISAFCWLPPLSDEDGVGQALRREREPLGPGSRGGRSRRPRTGAQRRPAARCGRWRCCRARSRAGRRPRSGGRRRRSSRAPGRWRRRPRRRWARTSRRSSAFCPPPSSPASPDDLAGAQLDRSAERARSARRPAARAPARRRTGWRTGGCGPRPPRAPPTASTRAASVVSRAGPVPDHGAVAHDDDRGRRRSSTSWQLVADEDRRASRLGRARRHVGVQGARLARRPSEEVGSSRIRSRSRGSCAARAISSICRAAMSRRPTRASGSIRAPGKIAARLSRTAAGRARSQSGTGARRRRAARGRSSRPPSGSGRARAPGGRCGCRARCASRGP